MDDWVIVDHDIRRVKAETVKPRLVPIEHVPNKAITTADADVRVNDVVELCKTVQNTKDAEPCVHEVCCVEDLGKAVKRRVSPLSRVYDFYGVEGELAYSMIQLLLICMRNIRGLIGFTNSMLNRSV